LRQLLCTLYDANATRSASEGANVTDSGPRVGEQRPGGRAARVKAAVLEATSELLIEVGYDGLSVDEVASRAGVHKTTVYRRWSSKAELVMAAVRAQSDRDIVIPDTGELLADLTGLARSVVANIGSEGGSRRSRSIIAAAASSDELGAGIHAGWAERLAATEPIIERGVERGEIPAASDPNLIIETLVGAIWLRLLLTGEPIDDDLAERIAELVTAGAAHGIATRPP
jgi:AcrR family transcriptional regulator